MSRALHKLTKWFSLRLFLNILLWLAVSYLLYNENRPQKHITEVYALKCVSLVSLMIFTYVNNLLLIPRYLKTRRYPVYLPLAALLVCLYALSYSAFIVAVVQHHTYLQPYQFVLFSVPMKTEWSLHAIGITAIGYAITFGIWLFTLTTAWYMHDHGRQRQAMLLAQQRQTETELNFLKAQINPHFLFNTLNNLYALALKKSSQSPDVILKLSSILRYLLYESNTPTVPFEREKEIMEAYIDIELLRLDHADHVHVEISADEPRPIPPLLWLPILENVFKHGTRRVGPGSDVVFRFKIERNTLEIYSKNQEKMIVKTWEDTGGIGLNNLQKRLELLYPQRHSMATVQEQGYHISQVNINLS